MYCFLSVPILALAALANALAISTNPEPIVRVDVTFPCDCIDHWFKHDLKWIRASSKDGCMALETNATLIWALNELPKPEYVSRNYQTLACSLLMQECSWNYSPLDPVVRLLKTTVDNATEAHAGAQPAKQPSQVIPRDAEDVRQFCEFLPEP
ncbi:hypothetical protein LTR84_000436 [Exophiala bonariae]|uniref:Uncharacterized protein n=1 Tax=Exophiala bonariae TaxID=1690606 RepID=A0AAV9NQX2_9EURO|nr:hypothetical protein LTR84_000436 [Exophiala bonariae]